MPCTRLFALLSALIIGALSFPDSSRAQDDDDALPIPRFVSLKSSEVNLRTGPGIRYPVRWIYHKKWLPMEVIEEFEHWRKIRDVSGESGWVHKTLLSGRRTVIVTADTITLFRDADAASPPVMRAEVGVVGDLLACKATWCRVQIGNIKGWTPKAAFWGAYSSEMFD